MAEDKKVISIVKPSGGLLDRFKSKRAVAIASVETLQQGLPHHPISQAKDFVRLHPSEDEYWSSEMCFVNVPIKGMKKDTLHLIDEELALRFLSNGKIQRFRLALATKPYDLFFLCQVPTRHLEENSWNASAVKACEQGKVQWVQALSRKEEGVEGYKIDKAQHTDAFPEPNWPSRTLDELITTTFDGRMIEDEGHAALDRLIGRKQKVT